MPKEERQLDQFACEVAEEVITRISPAESNLVPLTMRVVRETILPRLSGIHPSKWSLRRSGEENGTLAAFGQGKGMPISIGVVLAAMAVVYHVDELDRMPSHEELASIIKRYAKRFQLVAEAMETLSSVMASRLPQQPRAPHQVEEKGERVEYEILTEKGPDFVSSKHVDQLRKQPVSDYAVYIDLPENRGYIWTAVPDRYDGRRDYN